MISCDQFLAELAQILDASLTFRERLHSASLLLTQKFCDWCVVDLLRGEGEIERIVVTHRDPARAKFADALKNFPPAPASCPGVLGCIKERKTILMRDIESDVVDRGSRGNPEWSRTIRGLGVRSSIAVPLIARGRPFGALLLTQSDKNFSDSELDFATLVADRIAISADNASLYEQAQRAVQVREDTIAIVSHDLRNPLSSIQINIHMIKALIAKKAAADALDEKILACTRSIESSSQQALALISNLLTHAKLESGTFYVDRQQLAADAFVKESFELVRSLAAQKDLRVIFEITEGLPRIEADPARALQIMSNLLGNAIKFTPRGGTITLAINRSTDPGAHGMLTYSVRDTGYGIHEEFFPHIFKRYWQPQQPQNQGTGLGLSIVKGIVEAHGGRVWAESRVGVGSSFHFTLPISPVHTVAAGTTPARPADLNAE